jgi:hypothetical protein
VGDADADVRSSVEQQLIGRNRSPAWETAPV